MAFLLALVVGVPAGLAASFAFHGSIGGSDPVQKGQIVRDDPATTCDGSTAPAIHDSVPTHYDLYAFRNLSGSTQCVTVELAADPLLCPSNNPLQSAAYSPSFDPANIGANYLGDIGTSPNPAKSYSFRVAAGSSFDVTVNETSPGGGCNSYELRVAGSGITAAGPTAVGILSFTVTRTKRGALLRWRAGSRDQTLGFDVYREQSGKRLRLNRRLIEAGGPGVSLYVWLDRRGSSGSDRYWLREVGSSAAGTWLGPARSS